RPANRPNRPNRPNRGRPPNRTWPRTPDHPACPVDAHPGPFFPWSAGGSRAGPSLATVDGRERAARSLARAPPRTPPPDRISARDKDVIAGPRQLGRPDRPSVQHTFHGNSFHVRYRHDHTPGARPRDPRLPGLAPVHEVARGRRPRGGRPRPDPR